MTYAMPPMSIMTCTTRMYIDVKNVLLYVVHTVVPSLPSVPGAIVTFIMEAVPLPSSLALNSVKV